MSAAPPAKPRRPRPPSRYVTSCLLDGLAVTLWADLDRLRPLLLPWATPAPIPRSPRGKHPLCIEAWRVRAGRMESDFGDQHSWAERVGRMNGIALGGLMGWFEGGARGAMAGAQAASGAFGGLFRGWSETTSVLGDYNEVAITVPARLAGDDSGETFAYVAAMYTDSPVAIWGDRTMECGYRKQLASIVRSAAGACRVESPAGSPILSIDLARVAGGDHLGPAVTGPLLEQRLALAYLGGLEGRRFAISVMDRSASPESIVAAPVAGRITCAAGFVETLPAMSARLGPLTPRNPWGALEYEGISARLEYPRHGAL